MVFILGVNFPERNLVKRSLESFFGIGRVQSSRLLARHGIYPACTVGELDNRTILDLTGELTNMKIESTLKREILDNIRRLRDTGTYRGRRHAMGLPVRGQNTKSQIKSAQKLNKVERKL